MFRNISLAILTIIIITLPTQAQIIKVKRQIAVPRAILVKLPTYSKRIALYTKANNTKYAKQCINDAENMQKVMVADFNANFKFCDVYYFYDTCSEQVLQGKFDGILYDKTLNPLASSPIVKGDTSYQIVYFGHYVTSADEPLNVKKRNESNEEGYYVGSKRQRPVVVNYQFKRIPDPIPNGTSYLQLRNGSIFKTPKYKSKLFDIYYTELAKWLNNDMFEYYNHM